MNDKTIRVLLVEDDADHAELAIRALKKNGAEYDLNIERSLQAARSWLKANQPDILISDLRLPDGRGVDFLENGNHSLSFPVIIITSQGDEHHAVEAMKAGALDYVVKSPETFRDLPHIIQRALSQWKVMHEKAAAEEKLFEREGMLNSILQTAQDGYILLNHEGRILEINEAYLRMTGYKRETLLGKTVADLEYLQTEADIAENLARIREANGARFETRHRRQDGTPVDVEVSVSYLLHEEGKYVSLIRDISERKRFEQAFLQSETRYRTMFDLANEGIWAADANFNTTFANQRMADMLGYDIQEIIGKPVDVFILEDDLQDFKHRRNLVQQGTSGTYERRFKRKDGSVLWTNASSVAQKDTGGNFIGSFAMFTDITDRKNAEKEINRQAMVLAQIQDMVTVTDMDGRITFINEAQCQGIGRSREDLIGQTVHSYGEDSTRGATQQEIINTTRSLGEWRGEVVNYTADNREIILDCRTGLLRDENDIPFGMYGISTDITERKRIENALRESEQRLALVLREIPTAILISEVESGQIQYVNEGFVRMSGYTEEQAIGRTTVELGLYSPAERQYFVDQILKNGFIRNEEIVFTQKSGNTFVGLTFSSLITLQGEQHILVVVTDITERKRNEEALRMSEERFRNVVDTSPNAILVLQDGKYTFANPAALAMLGYSAEELIGMDGAAVIHPDDRNQLANRYRNIDSGKGNLPVELRIIKNNTDIAYAESTSVPIVFNDRPAILIISHDITERKKAAEEIKRSRDKLEEAEKLALLGNYEIDLATGKAEWSKEVYAIFGIPLVDEAPTVETYFPLVHPEDREALFSMFDKCALEGTPFDLVYRIYKETGEIRHVHSLARVETDERGNHTRMFGTLQDITDRIRVEQALKESQRQIEERMKQLIVLRDIDITITSSTNTHKIVDTILERLVLLPDLFAAILLIPEIPGGPLKIASQTGLEPPPSIQSILGCPHLDIDHAAQTLVPIFVNDYPCVECKINQHAQQDIRSCAILPLMVREEFKGILLLLSPQEGLFDRMWQDFAHSLAMQTAIALENATLFIEMQYKHLELMDAYESTIEGWSRTLEMRDKETKGHTERVTRISLLLAVAFGFRDEDLWNFRRGVLLHDIGKISIPDSILFKPGSLTDEEWIIMRQHPAYAVQMLSGIAVLEKAIDIPYCHHEKWDGTGYPRRLAGEDIPYAARIFAVVDVWDALTSDRPYRPAWTEDMARQYILEQSGTHFDPEVVNEFIRLLDSGKITQSKK